MMGNSELIKYYEHLKTAKQLTQAVADTENQIKKAEARLTELSKEKTRILDGLKLSDEGLEQLKDKLDQTEVNIIKPIIDADETLNPLKRWALQELARIDIEVENADNLTVTPHMMQAFNTPGFELQIKAKLANAGWINEIMLDTYSDDNEEIVAYCQDIINEEIQNKLKERFNK